MLIAEEKMRGTGRAVVTSQAASPTRRISTEERPDWGHSGQVDAVSGIPPAVRRI